MCPKRSIVHPPPSEAFMLPSPPSPPSPPALGLPLRPGSTGMKSFRLHDLCALDRPRALARGQTTTVGYMHPGHGLGQLLPWQTPLPTCSKPAKVKQAQWLKGSPYSQGTPQMLEGSSLARGGRGGLGHLSHAAAHSGGRRRTT